MERVILHCDCNSFYASVETVLHPEYRNIPMAVCGSKEDRHGIVLAKNEHAKKCGIKTGEAIWQAKKKCPPLVTVTPRHDIYSRVSGDVNRIYSEYTDRVEPYGIDESWLDITESAGGIEKGALLADELRARINREIGITVSVGVSFTKTFAKLGSDYKKPDATTIISREGYKRMIYPLPASEMMYVGRRIGVKLRMLGISTIGDLANSDPALLRSCFGKLGDTMHTIANGRDPGVVSMASRPTEAKSVGNGFTFKRDIAEFDEAVLAINSLCDEVSLRMRRAEVKAKTVQLGIRDTNLHVISRQKTLDRHTWLAREMSGIAVGLFSKNWNMRNPIRTLYINTTDLVDVNKYGEQMCLFSDKDAESEEKLERHEQAVDDIRQVYGKGILFRCAAIGNDLGL